MKERWQGTIFRPGDVVIVEPNSWLKSFHVGQVLLLVERADDTDVSYNYRIIRDDGIISKAWINEPGHTGFHGVPVRHA